MISPPKRLLLSNLRQNWGLVGGLVALVSVLEFSTPIDYVFGYLYVGPILLASARLGQSATRTITEIAVVLTLLNLWVPGRDAIEPATVANRAITVLALVISALLSDRNRQFQRAITRQEVQLQAQEELIHLREDFTSTLAHDLKTPMLGAIAAIDSLQRERFGPLVPEQGRVLKVMKQSQQASLQLLETLLDIYRNDSEGLRLDLAPLDLGGVIETAVRRLSPLAADRQTSIRMFYGPSGFRQNLWVNGDGLQLGRVFDNLLLNAIQHTLRGSQIEIQLTSEGNQHRVLVLDGGLGIPPEVLPRLFDRFYQGPGDLAPQGYRQRQQATGSGLGLYLSRQIVTAHGGRIWAENRSPTGAAFGVQLPAKSLPPN